MSALWPSEEEIADFKAVMLDFEARNWRLGMDILSCFALKLGFAEDFFTRAHDPKSSEYQCTLRLLHYLGMENAKPEDFELWRAGAHSDFDCLTLLHQRPGQGGLQVCPGKDAAAHAWTSVEPEAGYITCNIGDMLMRWSDDQLQSTLHRVRMPRPGEYLGPRLSLPFFCQANKDAIIQGPGKKYSPVTAARLPATAYRGEFRQVTRRGPDGFIPKVTTSGRMISSPLDIPLHRLPLRQWRLVVR